MISTKRKPLLPSPGTSLTDNQRRKAGNIYLTAPADLMAEYQNTLTVILLLV